MKEKIDDLGKVLVIATFIVVSSVGQVKAHSNIKKGEDIHKHSSILLGEHYHHGNESHKHENGICEFLKKEGANEGAIHGEKDGYKGIEENNYRPSTKDKSVDGYNESYIPAYENNYNLYKTEALEKLKEAKDKGLRGGQKGEAKEVSQYTNDDLRKAYSDSYELGYAEYKEMKIAEYKNQGTEDGKNGNAMRTFEEHIDLDYVEAYGQGYANANDNRRKLIVEEGYNDAINGEKAREIYEGIEKEWYTQSYKEGQDFIKELEAEAKKLGESGAKLVIPEKFEESDKSKELFEDNYYKAFNEREAQLAKEKKEQTTKTIIVATAIAITLIIAVTLIIKIKSNKNKENNNYKDDKVA